MPKLPSLLNTQRTLEQTESFLLTILKKTRPGHSYLVSADKEEARALLFIIRAILRKQKEEKTPLDKSRDRQFLGGD